MDKNSVIGLVLIGLLLVGYTIYQRPSAQEIEAQQRAQDSIAALAADQDAELSVEKTLRDLSSSETDELELDSTAREQVTEQLASRYGALATAVTGENKSIEVTTDLLKLKFSNKGGYPVSVELLNYSTYDSLPMILVSEELQSMGMEFTYPSLGNFNTNEFYFETSSRDMSLSGEDESVLVFYLELEGGRKIEHRYTVRGNSYDIGFQSSMTGMEGIVTTPKFVWELSALHSEKGIEAERNNSTIFYKELDHGRDYLSETGDDDDVLDDTKLQWVAFKQHFFSAILIAENPFDEGVKLASNPYPEENVELSQFYRAEIPLKDSGVLIDAKLFYGPNDYKVLKPYGQELDKVINLGWGIFGWVNKYIVITIFDWLETTGMSYGIIILVLTLVIKMILSPLTFKNYLSSAKMRVLKPEIEELNEKFKDADPVKKQQATMDLYRKTGVSPFAGCIPMVIQLPILYAMFRFFPSSIQLRHEPFLWADDLSAYDSIAQLPFSIPAYGDHVSLFTLLMCASTFVYTIYNSSQMPTQSQPGMPNMKVIMYIFPFMMLFFFNKFASGLSYYYFLANLISILQMLVIKKFFIDEDKIKLQIAENKKKKANKGKSKFQKRLEEMAKQRGLDTK